MLKIVFMGTPELAATVLDTMMEAGLSVSLAVSQPDRVRGRGRKSQPTPVHACADKWGIPVFQPVRVREAGAVERIRQEAPDLIVVAAFGQILPQSLLDIPRLGCINIHTSLLPRYRGAAPIQWAVINGEEKTGVTVMQMDAGLDTGDILLQEEVLLAPDETAASLYDRLSLLGGQMAVRAAAGLEAGTLTRTPQDHEASTYASMLTREMGKIDWTQPAAVIERRIRGMNPWPSCYCTLKGKVFKIWGARVGEEETGAAPGTVTEVTKKGMRVACGSGSLLLTDVQYEGKKRMPCDAFLRGVHVEAGEVLS